MITIFNNKYTFLKLKPKLTPIFFLLIIVVCILIFSAYNIKVFDTYKTKGIVKCSTTCTIKTYIPTTINYKKILFNNKEINYNELSREIIVDEENYISYYEMTYDIKNEFSDNEIVDINLYYNKQSIIKKIFSKVFRKEVEWKN